MRRRRTPRRIGPLGEDLVRRLDPTGSRHKSRVVASWAGVAGPEVDAHTRGFDLDRGELVVFVDSPAWAAELSAMSEDYRTRLNQEAGEELVRKIRFTVSRKTKESVLEGVPDPEQGRPRTPKVPLTRAEKAQIEHAAAGISDEGLRHAAVEAMVRDMERRRSLSGG